MKPRSPIQRIWFYPALFIAAVITLTLTSIRPNTVAQEKTPRSGSDYRKDWEAVEKKESEDLPKSAKSLVEAIYQKAKREENAAQQVKALMHLTKYQAQIEEEGLVKGIQDFEKEIAAASFPVKPLLNSVLADFYWQYYSNNRYKFLNRTPGGVMDDKDVRTWDLEKLLARVTALHQAAVQDAARLQQTPLEIYEQVLEEATNSKLYRPTLYDFIAHRAITFFINEERALSKPTNEFELTSLDGLAPVETFSKVKFKSENGGALDSASLKVQALLMYQSLARFHLADKNPDALIDLDLERLTYTRRITFNETKDSAYVAALTALERKYAASSMSTQVLYTLAEFYFAEGSAKGSDGLNGKQRALKIAEDAIARNASSRGGQNAANLKGRILGKNITLQTERSVEPAKPVRAAVGYTNVSKVFYRVVRVDDDLMEKLRYDSYDEGMKAILAQRAVVSGASELPLPQDYLEHHAEIKIDAVPKGRYGLLISAREDFSRSENEVIFSEFWSTSLSLVTANSYESDDRSFRVLHAQTGKPLAGVTAQLFRNEYDYTKRRNKKILSERYTTGSDGKFTVSRWRGDRSYSIELSSSDDRFVPADNYYVNNYRANKNDVEKIVLFTDRSIYRPGQTIYFKGILIKANFNSTTNEILPNESLEVIFYDVNYQKVSSVKLKTNEYGTFNGTFIAPSGVLNGQMQIQTSHRGFSGAVSFSVEDYKRPKFQVEFKPVKEGYKLGDKVKVTGFAKSYAGAAIDGAEVKYRVVRNTRYPYWRYWWMPMPQGADREIAHGTLKSDAAGEYEILFIAAPDKSIAADNKPEFTYTVYADVTDVNGETRSSSTSVRVGYIALDAEMSVPDVVNKEKEFTIRVDTKNLNGEFEAAKGTLTVLALPQSGRVFRNRFYASVPDQFTMPKEEFYRTFPHDLYADENIFRSDSLAVANAKGIAFDNAKEASNVKIPVASYASGKYVAVLQTQDRYGKAVRLEKIFTVYGEKDARPASVEPSYFVPLEKSGYEPGETAKVIWGSANSDVQAVYELEHRGKVIKEETLAVSNSQRVIEVPIAEEYRGGLSLHIYFVVNNRFYHEQAQINVPWSNKDLKLEFSTFRSKLLPGQKEEWRVSIKGPKAEKVAAEMVATLYDASLDAFRGHYWGLSLYPSFYSNRTPTSGTSFGLANAQSFFTTWPSPPSSYGQGYDYLNTYGLYFYEGGYYGRGGGVGKIMRAKKSGGMGGGIGIQSDAMPPPSPSAAAPAMEQAADDSERGEAKKEKSTIASTTSIRTPAEPQPKQDFSDVKARSNLNETAFFMPELRTNEKGEVVMAFTIPEALTKWRMLGIAHTQDLKVGSLTGETVTQKELMVQPNAPRFLRENDELEFPAKITNLTDKDRTGSARLMLFDAVTMKPIENLFTKNKTLADQSFTVKAGQSTPVSWKLTIPEGVGAVLYRVVAKAGEVSDGEEAALPVLSDRMLVTESLPLPVRSKQTKSFVFEKLLNSKSSTTLRNYKLTLEYTSNPAWYAVQALPYMMEFPHECAEQLFTRYYANSIGAYIANSNPKIKRVFEQWKSKSPEALLSNLEKNQELKQVMLEETPWLLDGKDESARKQRVALLFELSQMEGSLRRAVQQLVQMQAPNGGFPWFAGMPDNRWITQHIVAGFGHLDKLGVKPADQPRVAEMLRKAVAYLDDRMREDYEDILRYDTTPEDDHLSYTSIHYLYARSYFPTYEISERNKKASAYWKRQGERFWQGKNVMAKGMLALAFHRMGKNDAATATKMMKSIKEYAIYNDELGMYWKENTGGYYWYQAPVETQALLSECFDEVSNDKESVEGIKVWILKNKQVQDWRTTKATAEACYALLRRGTDLLASDALVELTLGGVKFDPKAEEDVKVEAGTGYFKKSWSGGDIKPEMANVNVKNPNDVVAWGALYWQYFERMDKITPAETPLKLKKQVFIQRNTDKGPVLEPITERTPIKVGDLIKIRVELRVDREMEFLHMKDMRASGFEPTNVISRYKYQGGLGYYESTRDAATHFFMDNVRKGTYVFEYGLRAFQRGKFQNGITTIQSMYAPEFNSHSEGIIVDIK